MRPREPQLPQEWPGLLRWGALRGQGHAVPAPGPSPAQRALLRALCSVPRETRPVPAVLHVWTALFCAAQGHTDQ